MNYTFMALAGINLIFSGVALYFDFDKPAIQFFIAACIFTIGI